MTALIEVRDLYKRFGSVTAVDGVGFDIVAGSCVGLLGPNGAGKTTTVEMLEGISRPSAGTIHYRGRPLDERFRREAGIMFQNTALQEHLTTREALDLFARFYARSVPLPELVERCALEGYLDRDTRTLSGGQRQRLLLAIALVNDPQVVFLDEPTTGLDPQARRNFWSLVRDIRARGRTVILTTHYMEEAYELCDTLLIMDHGRIIAEGSPRALLAQHFSDSVLQLPREDFPERDDLGLTVLRCERQVEVLTAEVTATVARLLAAGVCLDRMQVRERTLDDLFLELTGREIRS